ncbi:MAG TPA: carboxypeptidase-like regulatory domain-containing protein [Puia sp.]|nr:carboxypeptidase-like regulatory domain-containing protein [Puia sp.]
MKRYQYILLFLVAAAVSFQLHATSGKSGPCLIRGQVVDAVTKKPVSGVLVSVTSGNSNANEAVTDEEGYYYFKELPSNRVNLRFEKKGYQQFRYQEVVNITEKKTVKIDVEVHPESELQPDDSEYPLLRILGMK